MGTFSALYKLQKTDIPRATLVLMDAFQNDPIWTKIFKDQDDRERKKSGFFEMPVRHCMRYGEVYAPSEKLEGVMAWVPGTYADMTFWRIVMSGSLRAAQKMGSQLAKSMEPIFTTMTNDRKSYMQGQTYIYLLIIGVALQNQGKGFGGQMLNALIHKSEMENIPIYLETETEENVKLYEKYGFKVFKKITLPILDLPMWEMKREPNAAKAK